MEGKINAIGKPIQDLTTDIRKTMNLDFHV
jgi:hypothetical protein